MKKYILLLLMCICFVTASAQERYLVSVVKGRVVKANGSAIKVGTKLGEGDKVVFSSETSLLVLLHPKKGRMVISPASAHAGQDNTLTGLVKDYFEVIRSTRRLSARSSGPGDRSAANAEKARARADSARVDSVKKD